MRTIILKIEDEETSDRIEAALAAAGLIAEFKGTIIPYDTYHVREIPDHLRSPS